MEDQFKTSEGMQGDGTKPGNASIDYSSTGTHIPEMDKNPNSVDQKTDYGKNGKTGE